MPAPVPPLRISVTDQQERYPPNFSRLRDTARTVLEGEGVQKAKVNIVLLTDAAIHDLNRRFLQHDEPTDVITFPLSNPGAATLEAEILISTDTAQIAATEHGHDVESEILLYLVHGLLHLCGHDDHAPKDRKRMRAQERHYLEAMGVRLKGGADW
jgi:probable rRNA maturation factor